MAANYDFDEEAYRQYKDEIINSEGFHVLSDYGLKLMGGIYQVGKVSSAFEKAEAAAGFAVEEYNEKTNAKLKFLQVLNVNVEPGAGSVYYITLEAKEPPYELRQYHAKVWSTINNRFQLQNFRVAPYAAKVSLEDSSCCLRVDNLQPWMDESYLYYKCFYTAKELLSIQVTCNKPELGHGILQLKSRSAAEKVLAKYNNKLMPSANQVYKMVLLQMGIDIIENNI